MSGYYEKTSDEVRKYHPTVWRETERELKIAEWFDLKDGIGEVFKSVVFEPRHFTKIFNHNDDDDDVNEIVNLSQACESSELVREDFDCYTSEGIHKTTCHSKYMLVMWPQRFEFDLMLGRIGNLEAAIDSVFNSVIRRHQVIDERASRNLKSIVDNLIALRSGDNNSYKRLFVIDDDRVVKILHLLLKLKDASLVDKFLVQFKPSLTLDNGHLMAKMFAKFVQSRQDVIVNSIVSPQTDHVAICNLVLVIT